MAMRSPRLASIAALTILGAGLCAACGPVSLPFIRSSPNDHVPAAAKPAIAVPASSNPTVNVTPTAVSASTKKSFQPVAVTRGSIVNMLSVDGVVSPQDQTALTYPNKTAANAVNVKAGQTVHQGDSLIDFDSGTLPKDLDTANAQLQASQTQLTQAQARQPSVAQKAAFDQAQRDLAVSDARAGLQAAQANLASVQAGRPDADKVAQETAVSYGNTALKAAQAALDQLKAGPDQQTIQAAQTELAKDQAALQNAQAAFADMTKGPDPNAVRAAQNALDRAQLQVKIAQAAKMDRKTDPGVAALQHDANVQDAQTAVQNAQATLDKLKSPPTDAEVAAAQQKIADAQSTMNAAQAKLDALQNGPNPAAINAAQTNIDQIKHGIGEATANLNEVLSHPTPQELASAQEQVAKAQSALYAAQAAASAPPQDEGPDMGALQDAVKKNQANVAALQQQLANTHITAPFDAVIVSVRIKAGDTATPGKPLIILTKPLPPIVKADLADIDPSQVATGQSAQVQIDNGTNTPAVVNATVASISPAASDVGTAATALLQVDWADGQTPSFGAAVQVGINVGQKDDALLVPVRALHKSGSHASVEVQDGTLRRLVTVQVGISDGKEVEVVSGLSEGQMVLVTPSL